MRSTAGCLHRCGDCWRRGSAATARAWPRSANCCRARTPVADNNAGARGAGDGAPDGLVNDFGPHDVGAEVVERHRSCSGGTDRASVRCVGRDLFPQVRVSCIGICPPPSGRFPGLHLGDTGIFRDLDTHAGRPRSSTRPFPAPRRHGRAEIGADQRTSPSARRALPRGSTSRSAGGAASRSGEREGHGSATHRRRVLGDRKSRHLSDHAASALVPPWHERRRHGGRGICRVYSALWFSSEPPGGMRWLGVGQGVLFRGEGSTDGRTFWFR